MVATDGHRLAHIEKTGETLNNISGEKKTLIPRKALSELQSLLSNTEEESLEYADDDPHPVLPRRPSHPLPHVSSPGSSPITKQYCPATTTSS